MPRIERKQARNSMASLETLKRIVVSNQARCPTKIELAKPTLCPSRSKGALTSCSATQLALAGVAGSKNRQKRPQNDVSILGEGKGAQIQNARRRQNTSDCGPI